MSQMNTVSRSGKSKSKVMRKNGHGAARAIAKNLATTDFKSIGSAAGLSSLVGIARLFNWKPLGRRIAAKPFQAAAIVAVGVGAVLVARRLMSGEGFSLPDMSGEKLHH